MNADSPSHSSCSGLFVVRKPIFDRDEQVCAHEVEVGASELSTAAPKIKSGLVLWTRA